MRGYAEEGTTTTPFDLLAMNGVDRFQLAIEALSRVDIEAWRKRSSGMSGEFAVAHDRRSAEEAIKKFTGKLEELPRVRRHEEGNDPPEITRLDLVRERQSGRP